MVRSNNCTSFNFLYITDISFYWTGYRRTAPIYLNHVGCYGHENKLTDCSYGTHTIADQHLDDIGVYCNASTGGKPLYTKFMP